MGQKIEKNGIYNQSEITKWKSLNLHCPFDDEKVILKRILKAVIYNLKVYNKTDSLLFA